MAYVINMSILRFISSPAKLAFITTRHVLSSLYSLSRGDTRTALEHLRAASIFLHDDLVRLAVALQRRLPGACRLPSKVDRILVVKLDRIGDMVFIGPVLDALREGFPGARLEVVGHPVPLGLLEGDDRVDELIPYKSSLYHALPLLPPGPRCWWLLLKLLGRRYPLVVYVRGSFLFLPLCLTSRLAATKFIQDEHVIDRYLRPLEEILGAVPRRDPWLQVHPESARTAREVLSGGASSDGPRVVIHATASAAAKSWPAERFVELADRLHGEFQAQIHFVGGPSDQVLLKTIKAGATKPHTYHWTLKLPDVVALIAQCSLFIGNDSGLSHIAAAVGTHLVVIWGPASRSMASPRTRAGQCLILWHDLPCRPTCPELECNNPNHLECLTRTRVDDVLDASRRLLSRGPTFSPDGGVDPALPVLSADAVAEELSR
jgi:ADP-heptose:LPS heptosyltransferase